jgi:phenylpyruvate tautomerase PptA (4-oxalocrotonate tautomerase family)
MPEHVTNYLIEYYNKSKNPIRAEIEEMAIQTHLTTEKITNWFKRRRIQLKETKPNTLSEQIVKYLTDKYADTINKQKQINADMTEMGSSGSQSKVYIKE